MTNATNQSAISAHAIRALLGFRRPVPVTLDEMVRSLKVVFVPGTRTSPRLSAFGEKLRGAFAELGVRELTPHDALNSSGQLLEGVVPIYLGDPQIDLLALEQVPLQNLYSSQMVGIFDRKSPVDESSDLQTRLDAIVEVMTSNLVTLSLFVTDESWTMCTLNGAVATYDNTASITDDVKRFVIPKVAARVVPPRIADLTCRYETFDPEQSGQGAVVADFVDTSRVWAGSGLIGAHAALESIPFRSQLHRLLVTSFMDGRSGMSYGFLAWQLPAVCEPAVPLDQARREFSGVAWDGAATFEWNGRRHVRVRLAGRDYVAPVPDVSVVCTRSGCKKDQLHSERDLVCLTLSNGCVLLETPKGITRADDCRPSYDTFTILANALGNCLAASVLGCLRPAATFPRILSTRGLSLSHWHGFLSAEQVPAGYVRHGMDNPGVCCSTPQSAIYTLSGKLQALESSLPADAEFLGDVHIEPHHGTNLCGVMSLCESAEFVARQGAHARG